MGRIGVPVEARQHLPDFVFVADPGYMIVRARGDGAIALVGGDFDGYSYLDCGEDALPLFFLLLNLAISGMRLRRPDLNALWQQAFRESAARAVAGRSTTPPTAARP
jgi:hypothetical protein